MHTPRRRWMPTLLIAALALAPLAAAATAQDDPAPAESEEAEAVRPAAGVDVAAMTDAELEAVANAYLLVVEITSELQAEVEAAATPEEAQALRDDANEEVLAALAENGVRSDQYTAVLRATQQDEAFRDRFAGIVEGVRGEEGDGGP
ncbi:MAG TPA: DUF4168 domain-containing protein [Thermoanaerobaculia bacterium]|nr:DUF4168 domain-containing protein [Thermoanaerobaculia bacterium]